MVRWLLVLLLLVTASPSLAATVAIVDFERAVNETNEGKSAQKRLDTMYASRATELENMEKAFNDAAKQLDAQVMILSDDARRDAERTLEQKYRDYVTKKMQYQQEMQQTYFTLLSGLDEKMRVMTEQIAREKGYDVVLDKAAVVYAGGQAVDMTDELIKRYNISAAP